MVNRQGEMQSLDLAPRSLIHANVPPLRTLKNRQIDPDRIRLLIPVHFNAAWMTSMRARLAEIIQPTGGKLPYGTITKLTMHNQALDEEFIKEYLPKQRVRHHLVMVVTAGIEFHTGQNRKQALRRFGLKCWTKPDAVSFCQSSS